MSQITPNEVQSNLSHWFAFITQSNAPKWLQDPQLDTWWTTLFAVLAIASFLWVFRPKINSLVRWSRNKKRRFQLRKHWPQMQFWQTTDEYCRGRLLYN
jgi:hypothetical protein